MVGPAHDLPDGDKAEVADLQPRGVLVDPLLILLGDNSLREDSPLQRIERIALQVALKDDGATCIERCDLQFRGRLVFKGLQEKWKGIRTDLNQAAKGI